MDDWKAGGLVSRSACAHAPFRASLAALTAALATLMLATPSQAAEVGVVADVTWDSPGLTSTARSSSSAPPVFAGSEPT